MPDKKKIEVKVDSRKKEIFNSLLSSMINENALCGDFSIFEDRTSINIYLNDESLNTLVLRQNGTWTLE